jgi:hypothetical protein
MTTLLHSSVVLAFNGVTAFSYYFPYSFIEKTKEVTQTASCLHGLVYKG